MIVERHFRNRRTPHAVVIAAAVNPARVAIDESNAPLKLGQARQAGFIFEIEACLPIVALRLLRFLEQAAVGEIVRIGRVEIYYLETWNVAGRADDEVHRVAAVESVTAKHIVDAFRRACERAVRACNVAGDQQRARVVAPAGSELIGVRLVERSALPPLAAERIEDGSALDEIAVALLNVGVRRAAPQGLFEMAVLDLVPEALPKALDVKLEVRRRSPLDRAVQ